MVRERYGAVLTKGIYRDHQHARDGDGTEEAVVIFPLRCLNVAPHGKYQQVCPEKLRNEPAEVWKIRIPRADLIQFDCHHLAREKGTAART